MWEVTKQEDSDTLPATHFMKWSASGELDLVHINIYYIRSRLLKNTTELEDLKWWVTMRRLTLTDKIYKRAFSLIVFLYF